MLNVVAKKDEDKSGRRIALLASVLTYEHPELVARVERKMGLQKQDAELLFKDMLRFLFLSATLEKRLAPSESIDECWHNFILYTRDYAAFCNRFFGRFLHHTPTKTLTPEEALPTASETSRFAEKLFGPLSSNWTSPAASCECGDSTGCNGD